MDFEQKYLKYKQKYLELKKQIGSALNSNNKNLFIDKEMKIPINRNVRLIHLPSKKRGNFGDLLNLNRIDILTDDLNIIADVYSNFMLEKEYDDLHRVKEPSRQITPPKQHKQEIRPQFIPHVHATFN